MVADLFSFNDFLWGSSSLVLSLFLWVSSVCIPIYFCFIGSYWFLGGWYESMIMNFSMKLVEILSDRQLKIYMGSSHLLISLILVWLSFNVFGILPYTFSLTSHYIVSFSFSVPFWFATILMHFNSNWRSFSVSQIYESVPGLAVGMVYIAEFLSILARPITLAVRITMNIFIGQVILKIVSTFATAIFYPTLVTWGGFLVGVLFSLMTMFFLLVELIISLLQAFIFVGLLVFYMQEVIVEA